MRQPSLYKLAARYVREAFASVSYKNNLPHYEISLEIERHMRVGDISATAYNFVFDVNSPVVCQAVEESIRDLDRLPEGIQHILRVTQIPIHIANNWDIIAEQQGILDEKKRTAFLYENVGIHGLFTYWQDENNRLMPNKSIISLSLDDIYECRGSRRLTLFHEVGHFIDALSDRLSSTTSFRNAHRDDLISYTNLEPWVKRIFGDAFAYYFPKDWKSKAAWAKSRHECFAEIFAEQFYPRRKDKLSLARMMPRMSQSVQDIVQQIDKAAISIMPISDKMPHMPQTHVPPRRRV